MNLRFPIHMAPEIPPDLYEIHVLHMLSDQATPTSLDNMNRDHL